MGGVPSLGPDWRLYMLSLEVVEPALADSLVPLNESRARYHGLIHTVFSRDLDSECGVHEETAPTRQSTEFAHLPGAAPAETAYVC